VRLAFEVARAEGRKKVHCATKSNIMKLTEGFLKKTFEEVAKEYSDIEANHIIVDNCAHQLVKKPEQFDVIVTTNMNGDILSDLTSALVGGLGFAASANIGNDVAIFEAVHGSAPKYAGKNIINPIAVILSGVMMLRHLGEFEAANKIENAVAFTLEDGKERPRDICKEGETPTTTTKLTDTIIANFGKSASTYKARSYKGVKLPQISKAPDFVKAKSRRVVGMDVFVESALDTESLGNRLRSTTEASAFNLKMISSRGTKVFPSTGAITDTVDQFRCRFMLKKEGTASDAQCMELISQVAANFTWMHIEKLNEFDGVLGFTKAQGED
jgi:isocitrate dehydrogenase